MNISSAKRSILMGTLFIATLASQASIVSVIGPGDILIAGPAVGYLPNFFQDTNVVMHGWDEVQNYQLTSHLAVDITTLGSFNSLGSLTPGFIPAGTIVSSHTIYFDPLTPDTATTTFQFDGTIVGVIVNDMQNPNDPFLNSDFLIPGTVPIGNIPPIHFDHRGLELDTSTDQLTVGANFVTLSLQAGSPGDQVRVLTVVPEPGMGALMAVSGILFLRRRLIAGFR